jgi:hypothetical protein
MGILASMLPLPEIVSRLKAMNLLELERAAYEAQLRTSTLRKIRDGQTQDPRIQTVVQISEWMERQD